MADLLDGCRAKLDRASENIAYLEKEIARWSESSPPPHRLEQGLDDAKRAYVFKAYCSPVPLRLRVLIGEIVHHLRSSLDHLIWALALRKHTNPGFRIQFPICDTYERFEKALREGILKGISKPACDIVQTLQPYKHKVAANQALSILDSFSRTDKHKLLLVVSNVVLMGDQIRVDSGETDAALTSIIGMSPPPENLGLQATEQGTEVFSIQLGNYTPNFKATLNFTMQLSFEEFGTRKNIAILTGLTELRDATKSAIERFKSEF